jgi:DNA-binding transcriptional regulator YiaG
MTSRTTLCSEAMERIGQKRLAHQGLPAPPIRRALRQSAGLSQQDVADAVGATREAVSRWESGDRRPRGRLLICYVELLKVLR